MTANGNIASLQSPTSNFDQIAQGGVGEGYGVCDVSTGVSYYDWAYTDSGTWSAPVLVSRTATSIKIARTTTDGLWTLTQTIAPQTGAQPYVKMTMALKNNTAITKDAYLVPYADVDPAAAPFTDTNFLESFDSSQYGAWGYGALNNSVGDAALGVMLEEVGQPNVPYGFEGIAQNTSAGPNPCNPTGNYAGYQASVDGSVELFWILQLGAAKTGIVKRKVRGVLRSASDRIATAYETCAPAKYQARWSTGEVVTMNAISPTSTEHHAMLARVQNPFRNRSLKNLRTYL